MWNKREILHFAYYYDNAAANNFTIQIVKCDLMNSQSKVWYWSCLLIYVTLP